MTRGVVAAYDALRTPDGRIAYDELATVGGLLVIEACVMSAPDSLDDATALLEATLDSVRATFRQAHARYVQPRGVPS